MCAQTFAGMPQHGRSSIVHICQLHLRKSNGAKGTHVFPAIGGDTGAVLARHANRERARLRRTPWWRTLRKQPIATTKRNTTSTHQQTAGVYLRQVPYSEYASGTGGSRTTAHDADGDRGRVRLIEILCWWAHTPRHAHGDTQTQWCQCGFGVRESAPALGRSSVWRLRWVNVESEYTVCW